MDVAAFPDTDLPYELVRTEHDRLAERDNFVSHSNADRSMHRWRESQCFANNCVQ